MEYINIVRRYRVYDILTPTQQSTQTVCVFILFKNSQHTPHHRLNEDGQFQVRSVQRGRRTGDLTRCLRQGDPRAVGRWHDGV